MRRQARFLTIVRASIYESTDDYTHTLTDDATFQSPMTTIVIVAIAVLFLLAAMLYSSVGHAGASGYLAVMALFGLAPAVMKPTALALNILVAAIATLKFYRAGRFSFELFWPFAVTSIPAAFIGGAIMLPARWYDAIVGVALLCAAVWMFRSAKTAAKVLVHQPPVGAALACGLVIGLLSGLTGVGGGIFLSPLILMMGWAETRATSAVAAAFILCEFSRRSSRSPFEHFAASIGTSVVGDCGGDRGLDRRGVWQQASRDSGIAAASLGGSRRRRTENDLHLRME